MKKIRIHSRNGNVETLSVDEELAKKLDLKYNQVLPIKEFKEVRKEQHSRIIKRLRGFPKRR